MAMTAMELEMAMAEEARRVSSAINQAARGLPITAVAEGDLVVLGTPFGEFFLELEEEAEVVRHLINSSSIEEFRVRWLGV